MKRDEPIAYVLRIVSCPMDKRLAKRLLKAQNPRARKRNAKSETKFVRPSSHVGAVLEEIANVGKVPDAQVPEPHPYALARDLVDASFAPVVGAGLLMIAAAQDGLDAIKSALGRKERMLKTERRRKYYAADAERRARQREMLNAARPPVTCACPTPQQLNEAYVRRRESDEAKERFGELMIDLEEHVRREFKIAGNKFVGSSGGVKDWLKENCPTLAAHYATCQRYKRLVQEGLPHVS